MNNMVLGKYLPLDTLIHRLDPRTKIIWVFLMLVGIFVPKSWYAYGFLAVVIGVIVMLSGVGFKMIFKSFKPMIFMMFFLLVVNCLTVRTGEVLVTIASFDIYSDAVNNTLFIVVRLLLMVMVTATLTVTTKPLDLTLGLESLMKPLKKVGFPTHEVSMMISIALRFIPTIIEETMRIMNSQKSRGVDFDEGSLKEKIGAVLSLIVPLFTVAFQRAYELADAMEARGYIPGAKRTRFHVLKFKMADFGFMAVSLLICLISVASRFYL